MDPIRTSVDERNAARVGDAFGARSEAHAVAAAHAGGVPAITPAVSARQWFTRGVRLVRNAFIAVAVMALIPIGLVTVGGESLGRLIFRTNSFTAARVAAVAPVRQFVVTRDATISPAQAGATLNTWGYREQRVAGFDPIVPTTRPVLPWRTMQSQLAASDMFPTARPDFYEGPSTRSILEAAAKGLNPRERQYLRTLASAPVWRDFDLVARAPAVDMIGGMFRLPFGPQARPEQRPLPSYREARELAYAGVSRAAYHMSIGQRDSAEAALRSIISVGFMYIDNGTGTLDVLIGSVIAGVGRDALQRFYLLEHDPRAALPALRAPTAAAFQAGPHLPPEEARRRLLARIADPSAPMAERFEGARALSMTSCTNVRELMFGPRSDVTTAFAVARRDLQQFPSQRALFELDQRVLEGEDVSASRPFRSFAVSSAAVAGLVLHNPRLVTCTRVLAGW